MPKCRDDKGMYQYIDGKKVYITRNDDKGKRPAPYGYGPGRRYPPPPRALASSHNAFQSDESIQPTLQGERLRVGRLGAELTPEQHKEVCDRADAMFTDSQHAAFEYRSVDMHYTTFNLLIKATCDVLVVPPGGGRPKLAKVNPFAILFADVAVQDVEPPAEYVRMTFEGKEEEVAKDAGAEVAKEPEEQFVPREWTESDHEGWQWKEREAAADPGATLEVDPEATLEVVVDTSAPPRNEDEE